MNIYIARLLDNGWKFYGTGYGDPTEMEKRAKSRYGETKTYRVKSDIPHLKAFCIMVRK